MKLIQRLFSLLFLLAASAPAYAFSVKGTVTDSIGEPEPYATIRVYLAGDTTKISAMGVTTDEGQFDLKLSGAGKYILKVFSIGRRTLSRPFGVNSTSPTANLGKIVVFNDEKTLEEVTVTAIRPVVTKEIDRIGYDVQADEESKTSTLEEMLRKVPLVSVDSDGQISVKGSSDFKIYKNGRPNNSFTNNAKDIFKAIPASMIKKIEVITDPGAREDAEGVGAILNIVTLENTSVKGVMGNVSLNYNSRNNIPTPNFWGSSQIDKVTLSLYAGASQWPWRSSKSRNESTQEYYDSGNTLKSQSLSSSKGLGSWFGLDGSYELDSLNLLTMEFGGYVHNMKWRSEGSQQMFSKSGDILYSYNSNAFYSPSRYLDINGGFNYQRLTRRKGERFTLSYQISTSNQSQNSLTEYSDQFNMPVSYDGIISSTKLNFIEHTFQADWSRLYGEIHTLDLGLKYINRNNHSKTQQNYLGYLELPLLDFKHITHVAAAYADYRVRLNRFNLRGGLRYEFSRLAARYADQDPDHQNFASNLSDLVPNAAVSYNINDSNTLKISYATRINRPGIAYLNPQVAETPTTVSKGNPDLGSARNQSISLNYNFIGQKFNMDFSAGYSFTDNDIISVQYILDDILYSDYANAGKNKRVNFGLFAQWTAGKKTTLMINGNASYNHYKNPSYNITNGGWNETFFFRLQQKLPWDITGSAQCFFHNGNVNGLYGSMKMIGLAKIGYGISLQKSFLKENRLTIRVSTWNPFFPSQTKYVSQSANLPYNSTSTTWNLYNRMFQFSISYRFGSLNAQVKKTVKSISNDDLTGGKIGGTQSTSESTGEQ